MRGRQDSVRGYGRRRKQAIDQASPPLTAEAFRQEGALAPEERASGIYAAEHADHFSVREGGSRQAQK